MRYTTACTDEIYRDLVESQSDPLVRFSPEGRLLYVNPAYCAVMGKTSEELEGGVFMPVTNERYTDVIATQMTKLFRPPFACLVDQWIQTPKGLKCFEWSARSILDDTNSVKSIIASGRDVTRFKRDKKTIRKRDDELMLVIESGRQMYYSHTIDHTMTFVSPRIRSLLGCHPRASRWTWTDYLTDNPVNAAGLERTLKAIKSGRRVSPYRLEMTTSDGSRIWVEVNEIPVVKNGKTVAIVGSLIDITEKMGIEEGHMEAENLFKETAVRRKDTAASGGKSPFGFLRAIFAKSDNREDDDEYSFDIPKGLN